MLFCRAVTVVSKPAVVTWRGKLFIFVSVCSNHSLANILCLKRLLLMHIDIILDDMFAHYTLQVSRCPCWAISSGRLVHAPQQTAVVTNGRLGNRPHTPQDPITPPLSPPPLRSLSSRIFRTGCQTNRWQKDITPPLPLICMMSSSSNITWPFC